MFYYMDLCSSPLITEFVPRIPIYRMYGENKTIPRICLSKSIEGCINAAPWGGISFSERKEFEVFRLYEFDETKIKKNNILDTRAIYNCGYVDDAIFTKEVWVINQTLIPDNVYYIQVKMYYDTETLNICSYEQKRNKSSNHGYISLIREPQVNYLDKNSLFFGKEFYTDSLNLDYYIIENNLPLEIDFDYDEENGTIYFDEEVIINPKNLVA